MDLTITERLVQEAKEETTIGRFKRFDVVHGVPDYNLTRRWYQARRVGCRSDDVVNKVIQEWRCLEDGLPESIYVRAYKDGVYLLRAVIVGPKGTPYHDGLFLFDVYFPRDFPAQPPEVSYRSFVDSKLSHYICECCGEVEKFGNWDPSGSTVLQLLLSIQQLILAEKPYFNNQKKNVHSKENDATQGVVDVSMEKRSLIYNEKVFLESCETMLYLLSHPPYHFNEIIAEHFHERSGAILTACKAYMKGEANVGGDFSLGAGMVTVSDGFKTSLERLYPHLVTAFDKNNVYVCSYLRNKNKGLFTMESVIRVHEYMMTVMVTEDGFSYWLQADIFAFMLVFLGLKLIFKMCVEYIRSRYL